MREVCTEDLGIKIGGRNSTNLRYVDYTALIADNAISMRRIIYRVDEAGRKAELTT